jgi:NHLM bacteriocin system ABC transporter ATP-binding protein
MEILSMRKFCTGLAVTLLGILNPYATTILFDNAIPNGDKDLLLQVGLGLLVATLGASIFLLAQGFALLRVETRGEAVAQTAVWNRLLSLPVSFARRYTTGDLLSRVLSVITIRQQLSGPTLINFTNGLFALFYLGLLIYYNWQLSIIPLIAAGLTIVITVIGGLLLMRIFNPLLELQGQITGQNVQLINGISKLRIASAEKSAFATWSKNYTQQVKLEIKAQQIEDWIILFTKVMPTIASGVLFFTLRQLSQNQITNEITGIGLSIGTILAFNSAFSTFLGGVSDLNNSVSSALRVLPQSKRLEPILQTKPEVELGKTEPGRLKGNLFIDHVTFRYRSNGPLILDNVSINAQPGEFIALVGSSGSGKSTLLRLLLGFETPESGTVYYDGQDLLGLDRDAVRRQLGVVLQNARLMSGSIFENIAGGSQITLEEAWEASRLSGLADDIEAMPMEMHTVINEGASNISGGQRQRLLIARALALKPRLLLFDEATSALDNRTQAIVSESLEQLKVTRIVIAHRLSTIRHAHRIYVLQAGRIVQQGCFEDLASQEGLFARLIARQIA